MHGRSIPVEERARVVGILKNGASTEQILTLSRQSGTEDIPSCFESRCVSLYCLI